MNMIEKILARASGRAAVAPGDVVVANVDCLLLHDLSGYLTGKVFEEQVNRLKVGQEADNISLR